MENFVNTVTEEVLKQLFDALESDGVFDKMEEKDILQEDQTTAHRAHCFITSIKQKGDEACRKMMKHFQTTDPKMSSGPSAEEGIQTPYSFF